VDSGKLEDENAEGTADNLSPDSGFQTPESNDRGAADTAKDSELTEDEGKNDAVKSAGEDANAGNGGEFRNGGDSGSAPRNELAAERDRYLRLAAEYDNFRKRSAKERENTYSNARAETITRLLPVYDNLERALKMECADDAFYKGVEMTMTQLTEILDGMNVRRIQAVGEPFDPNRHYAVMSVENPELGEKVVAEEFQKGFMLGERVIRHATVVVAN